MTTTDLIKILKDTEYGGISHKPRNISLTINGKYMPDPRITLSSTGDGIAGPEIDLDIDGEFFEEQQPCEDKIIEWKKDFKEYINALSMPGDDYKGIMEYIAELPVTFIQSEYNTSEWCRNCSEYNQDKHCCPRFNKVIRNTVEEIKEPKMGYWISYWDEDARCYVYKCPECGNKQPFDTKHCWECGTRLIVPRESENKE